MFGKTVHQQRRFMKVNSYAPVRMGKILLHVTIRVITTNAVNTPRATDTIRCTCIYATEDSQDM
jgi:hypothetical protein